MRAMLRIGTGWRRPRRRFATIVTIIRLTPKNALEII